MRADGNCRACMVEIKGERVLAPSCCRYPNDGMEVTTNSARALAQPEDGARAAAVGRPRDVVHARLRARSAGRRSSRSASRASAARHQPPQDLSHPAIAVHLDACIQCGRCVRACREEQVNDVIGYAFRGSDSKIVFDLDDPMGDSTCVACGECVQACPTGALMPARDVGMIVADKTGRLGLSVLRRRLPAHLSRQGQHDPLRAGAGTARRTRAGCASRAATASTTSSTGTA